MFEIFPNLLHSVIIIINGKIRAHNKTIFTFIPQKKMFLLIK